MSRELEALEKIRQDFYDYLTNKYNQHNFDIIETALKEKETQDNVFKTLKEVIEFKQTLPRIEPNKDNGLDIMHAIEIHIRRDIENRERELLRQWVLETCFPKELKALEIIKNKEINIHAFLLYLKRFDSPEGYDTLVGDKYKITQEEYDILKEVLF